MKKAFSGIYRKGLLWTICKHSVVCFIRVMHILIGLQDKYHQIIPSRYVVLSKVGWVSPKRNPTSPVLRLSILLGFTHVQPNLPCLRWKNPLGFISFNPTDLLWCQPGTADIPLKTKKALLQKCFWKNIFGSKAVFASTISVYWRAENLSSPHTSLYAEKDPVTLRPRITPGLPLSSVLVFVCSAK